MCECVCKCVCVCVLAVAGQPKFQRPIHLSKSSLGDCKVARVGRPATYYKLVFRPWESDIRLCISYHFPTAGQLLCACVCVCVCVCACYYTSNEYHSAHH